MKAKLSNYYLRTLTPWQRETAREIIRAIPEQPGPRGADVEVGHPSLGAIAAAADGSARHCMRPPNNQKAYFVDGRTAGEAVCEAVLRGYIPISKPDGSPAPQGQGPGVPGGEGEEGQPKPGKPEGKPGPGEQGQAKKKPAAKKPAAKPEPKPTPPHKQQQDENVYQYVLRRMIELRKWIKDREESDHVSTRSIEYGLQMLTAGLPPEAVFHAYALDWPETSRSDAHVDSYDPNKYGKSENGYHAAYPYVKALCEARVPTLLVGPAGTGKGYLARNIADSLDLSFGACPLTGGASPAWLLGRQTAKGFVSTPFIRAYSEGGVFLFDELDAADPNMLLVVNDALANDSLENPVTGQTYAKSPDFVPIAAANTYGTGADAEYTGRERLDGATRDRFRMGRVTMQYDQKVETSIMERERKAGIEKGIVNA